MASELGYDLQKQIPELKAQRVTAQKGSSGEVTLTIQAADGTWLLTVDRNELSDINLLEGFGVT